MASSESLSSTSVDNRDSLPTVLFVDDEPDLLLMYDELHAAEFPVLTASSGREAIEMVETHGTKIEFAFFDRRLPDFTGEELIQAVRNLGYDSPLGIISAAEPDPDLGVEYDVYLTKPVTDTQVTDAILEHTS